ncbi:jg7185 [Pararge aegeria aegeria]|uniref:Jg7185 protein n=1 Tax=Pararge aegeria aegeria TaxID=348720 RepID=A0A8S4R996_9NEOP|nr:jg7185 [Pararge aegeria aegeria]
MEVLYQNKIKYSLLYTIYKAILNTNEKKKVKIIPSDYVREMKMSTTERIRSLNCINIDNIVHSGKTSKVVLSFTPKIIVFQNFKPNDKLVAKFSVKNISKGPTFLNMAYKESSYFFIKPVGGQLLSRLAPGISVSFAVTFQPVQYEDYTHRVTFYTDIDQYVLPLIAMGPRPVFDFPDKIVIPKTPLKVENQLVFSVHNVGMVAAGFTLNVKCPFTVQPKSAYMNPSEKIDIRVGFKTMHLVETQGTMHATFETGENFGIKLTGSTYTVSIELEKQVVRFLDTYKTMVRQQTLKITNKSDYTLTYMCMKNDCVYNDFEDKVNLATIFYDLKQHESAKSNKLVHYDVLSSEEHLRVYTRIFYDEIQALVADESLVFQNTHISVTPIKGKLWPNKVTELTITFAPKDIGEFDATVYLDVDGVNDRLPLKIVGTSLPPLINLNLETLDMDNVYINNIYKYEIVATNKGVPKTMELEVINESQVNVNANIKISSDGPEIRSITLRDYAVAEKPKPQLPQWPREFDIEPYNIKIGRESTVSIRVTLTANLIRANQTYLELEIDKSDSPPIVLPVTFNAMVPQIIPAPDIKMRACFTDYRYTLDVNVVCQDFWGYFTLEEPEEESTLEVEVGIKQGIIEPNSILTLPVTVKTSVLGIQEHVIRLNLFGMSKPVEVCRITGCGMRPIVTCNPIALHWGQVKLLTRTQKVLTLCNDSPVNVNFRVSLLNRDGRWHVNPMEGYIEPESETQLIVSLYLIDADSYTNKAVIHLENVKDILVPLSAAGIGTSISVGEHRDKILLGRHFTKIPLNCKVMMENCGTRFHVLEWSQHYKAPKTKQHSSAFFNMESSSFKISAGEKIEMSITGLSYKVSTIKEMWYLIGSVEGINKKELLLECQVVAEFVDPKIELSASIIDFQYNYGPYSEFYKLTDLVTIKNVSKLPLDFEITVKQPFAFVQKHGSYKVSQGEEMLCGCICYNEADLKTPSNINEYGLQRSKLFIDYLTLKPVDPQRKGPLHFFEDINKIKWAFNLTYLIEERLEDQEEMKIHILFDTSKHTTLKSRVYCDLMRLRFKGHKNKREVQKVDRSDINFNKCSTPITEAPASGGAELHEILACRTPAGSPVYALAENNAIDSPALMNEEAIELSADYSLKQENNNIETRNYKVITKISPMIKTSCDTEFEWIHKFVKLNKRYDISINDLLEVVPHSGLLKPNEVQYVNVIFRPKVNINVRATLECEVLGGPPETITVTGQSSDLLYKLNTHKINFMIRSFHENASEVLIMSNISQLPFEYKTYLNEPKFENDLYGTILGLTPTEKVLEPGEQTELEVEVRPGVVGYFHTTFILEMGHIPFVPIEVVGWGVIPQVYVCLPRPDISQLDSKLGYKAIPILTPGYLEAINKMFTTSVSKLLNSPLTEKCFEDRFFQQDWHICSAWDAYPSTMDIEMAIERMLVTDYITLHPDILNSYQTTSKTGSIPGFSTTPYVIDFSVVITGSTIHCSVDIINYGPIVNKLHFAKGTHIPNWLTVKLCGKLNPGESGKLEVTFAPTSILFTELEQHVETSFNIEVPYGVTIPIQITALCAVPYLASNVSKIDFGSVQCGDKIISKIPLKNVGKPTCIWFVTLKLKNAGTNALMVLNSSGKYDPGEGGWLSISFKPTMEMLYEGFLIFKFHMNPNRLTIPVIGQGIVPQVHIIGPNVTFPPTLPWAESTEFYFGLTNPCPFPVELIITHSDKKWKEEDEIYQLLNKFYNNPDEMLVPAIKPGAGMPAEIVYFYEKFMEKVKKKTKSPKNAPKSSGAKDVVSPKVLRRSDTEIIADVIMEMKSAKIDPLQECLHGFDTISIGTETDKRSKGMVILVHGSPCEEMQCQEMAYSLGKALRLPTVNIDCCIVDALCVCDCAAKSIIISAIDELYETARKYSAKEDEYTDAEECEAGSDKRDDPFDIILKKIKFLAVHKNVGTPRSKVSVKKKKKSPTSSIGSHTGAGAVGSTTMFHMDLVQELLTDYFKLPKFEKGFIVDSLTSNVIQSPPVVLTTVIKSKHTIWNIHLLLCHSDFNKWSRAYEELQREPDLVDESVYKVYCDTEIKNIVESLNNMESEEYENISPELKAIFVSYGLEERRRKHYEKVGLPSDNPVKDKTNKDAYSKSVIAVDNESKKKIKKEDLKGKPTSEYVLMNIKYNDYLKNTFERLVNIANNWITAQSELGSPLYDFTGQVVNLSQKKSKKKSYVQLQIKKCECNQLNDLNLLDDTNQDNVLNILSKWHCTCGKKVTSSQTSTSEIPSNSMERMAEEASEIDGIYPLPLRNVQSLLEQNTRIVLQPGDLLRCKYTFNPQYEGKFNVRRFVEVSGWPDSRVDIVVTGICDLPRIYEEKYTIDLRNPSLLTTDIVIEFLDDTPVFEVDKTFVRLEPGCRGNMSVSAAPTEVGVHMCNILFCVKDNPEIVSVAIACSGVVPIIEILPLTKMIEYGKHLLYRREDDRFIVKNDSILPIMWKIRNAEDFVQDFIISETTCVVPRNENQVVAVTYIASRVGVVSNKPLTIDIYDAEGRGDPLIIDTLFLSAECYDVMVECAYEIPSENYLNYGNVKVNSTVVRELYMLNRGRYNVYYKFTLFPLGELNFDIIPVGSAVTREVILNNTSKCPFTYTIVLPPEYQIDRDDTHAQVKIKDNKLKNPPLRCGNFLIMNDDNLLAPGTSRTLQLQFLATAAKTVEETINFIISDTCPAEAQGVPLKLVGTGAMPSLDFWNIENTFREHLIVKNLSEYTVPEPSAHCVFVEDSVTLHFFSVTVNSKFVAVIDLYNSGLVACALTMKLHYQTNSNQDIFSLDKYETHIEPLLHKNLGIIFPKTPENSSDKVKSLKNIVKPGEIATIYVKYNPIRRGRTSCDVKLTISKNPYEFFAVLCEAEAFMEDVILVGLEMLSMDIDLEAYTKSVEGYSY